MKAESKKQRVKGERRSMLYALCYKLPALFYLLIGLYISSCGYTLYGKAGLPFDAIQIDKVENRTLEPKLQDRFQRVMTEELLKHGIRVIPNADYKLSGSINFFEMNVLAERNVAVEYEVVMRGDFRLIGPSRYLRDIRNIGSPFIVSFPGSGMLEDVLAAKELASEKALKDMAIELVGIMIYTTKKIDSSNEGSK